MLLSRVLPFLFLLLFAIVAPAAEIRIAGGGPPIDKVLSPIKEKFSQDTGIPVVVFAQGPDNALRDFVAGKVEAMLLFLVPEDLERFAKKINVPLDMAGARAEVLVEDTVVFVVNPANPLKRLSREHLTGVFSGKVENWKEIGGAAEDTVVVLGELTRGLTELATNKVFAGTPITKDTLTVRAAQDVVSAVAANKGAVGISSTAVIGETVRALEEPRFTVRVVLYTRGEPSAELKRLIPYMKK